MESPSTIEKNYDDWTFRCMCKGIGHLGKTREIVVQVSNIHGEGLGSP